jgi:hypothetical protein
MREIDDAIRDVLPSYRDAVAEYADKLIVLASIRNDPNIPAGPGKIVVLAAPDLSELERMRDLGVEIICFSWQGSTFEVKDGTIYPLQGLPYLK